MLQILKLFFFGDIGLLELCCTFSFSFHLCQESQGILKRDNWGHLSFFFPFFFFFSFFFSCFVLNPFPFLITLTISVEDFFPITSNTLYYSLDFVFWQLLI